MHSSNTLRQYTHLASRSASRATELCHYRTVLKAALSRGFSSSTVQSQRWNAPSTFATRNNSTRPMRNPAGKAWFTSSSKWSSDTNAEPEESTTFSDPSRPGLFYHFLATDPPTFALSFLKVPPAAADSISVIGWLPARTFGQEDEAGLNDFRENREYAQRKGYYLYLPSLLMGDCLYRSAFPRSPTRSDPGRVE